MAHLRDELGTKVGVAEFDKKLRGLGTSGPTLAEESSLGLSHDPPLFNVSGVEISQLQTYRVLDLSRSQVHRLVLRLFRFVNGTDSTAYLDALRSASPIRVEGVNAERMLAY
jgi:hypothetical protein